MLENKSAFILVVDYPDTNGIICLNYIQKTVHMLAKSLREILV